jgi:hypothetical protein
MCDWRNADNRGGAHSVVAVRLGRGKGYISLTSFCLLGDDIAVNRTFKFHYYAKIKFPNI